MPIFTVIEAGREACHQGQGKPLYESIKGEVSISQSREGGDATVNLAADTSTEEIDLLYRLITRAFGNPPIPEIAVSIKSDRTGGVVMNGEWFPIHQVKVRSESLIVFQREGK